MWSSVSGGPDSIFSCMLAHPFLTGLVDGTLCEQAFKFYIVQGALYLRQYSRALALVASKAPADRPAWTAFLARCANEAYAEEDTFHKEFLAYYNTTVDEETVGTRLAPSCQLYATTILSTVHERAFYEGMAAILPCFIVYLEVAKTLQPRGSPHLLYQKFIDRFGGAEYESLALEVVQIANAVAAELGETQRQRMRAIFEHGCQLEYMFFDACYTQQRWPLCG
ncbi:thiaminase II [Chlorella sorokiniana]|uniref:Thiaminase II n=1 Tax=Chlorella sorokiniana TaxID=3076 RepID=A0A2P6TPP6_CHLSO|nr:thiaminase II [Chlorella sorokiniana]|eukprot:PRW56001.1 thiaminase II [Chlorella sorokiniana]